MVQLADKKKQKTRWVVPSPPPGCLLQRGAFTYIFRTRALQNGVSSTNLCAPLEAGERTGKLGDRGTAKLGPGSC
ncbi:hypothetical protein ACLKA6_010923 [Drosophila palustris]